jgi:hypothetical protein
MKHLFAAILLFGPTLALASSPSTPGVYAGAGMASCGKYLSDSQRPDLVFGYTSWMQGFLSGANLGFSGAGLLDPVTLPDSESIKLYMDNFCKANPLKNVKEGSMELFKDVHARNAASK